MNQSMKEEVGVEEEVLGVLKIGKKGATSQGGVRKRQAPPSREFFNQIRYQYCNQ